MRRIWLRTANSLPAFTIPFPNQPRIFCECFWCRQFRRIQVSPISVLTAKGRNPALGRNSSPCDDKDTHWTHTRCHPERSRGIPRQAFLSFRDGLPRLGLAMTKSYTLLTSPTRFAGLCSVLRASFAALFAAG